ncbi:MAG: FAD-dependent oxidoreductase [Chloroflexi bacterium]|nr:FAD-dependent oxidoreductase [Chloroflexota bacterium]
MQLVFPAQSLPVLYETEALVVGGCFAGIATALRLAGHHRRVVLIEPRTYLGREVTTTLRHWYDLPASQESETSLPELIRHCLRQEVGVRAGRTMRFSPTG